MIGDALRAASQALAELADSFDEWTTNLEAELDAWIASEKAKEAAREAANPDAALPDIPAEHGVAPVVPSEPFSPVETDPEFVAPADDTAPADGPVEPSEGLADTPEVVMRETGSDNQHA